MRVGTTRASSSSATRGTFCTRRRFCRLALPDTAARPDNRNMLLAFEYVKAGTVLARTVPARIDPPLANISATTPRWVEGEVLPAACRRPSGDWRGQRAGPRPATFPEFTQTLVQIRT